MIKKLSKHGNSLAILIEKPILELLNIDENTHIRIKTDGNKIIIEPIQDRVDIQIISEDTKMQKLYAELMEKYDTVLKKLAKN